MSTMLYKHPGKHKIHGEMFDYIIVDDADIDAHLKKGWHQTTPDALGKKTKKPTEKESLQQEADKLNLTYAKNVTIKTLKKLLGMK